ncbi:hypothetical protein BDV96DRAFT_338942 [Lophiotrema nucula]|uniref:Uncharacterized protein n=1 Tax=Lophiotrema nucula TaxID=690887 RepID=A0A6A5YFT9_9PLEO|nr:hypothetical protein BDV96DRAFT_338942 [Lophiotrema nucula]
MTHAQTAPASTDVLNTHTPSHQGMGKAFKKGWESLSDELRTKILRSVLVYDTRLLSVANIDDSDHKYRESRCHDVISLVSCRATAGLAEETFYRSNLFTMFPSLHSPPLLAHSLPISVAHHIRRLVFLVPFESLEWALLKVFVDDFPCINLEDLQVTFYILADKSEAGVKKIIEEEVMAEPIDFHVKRLVLKFDEHRQEVGAIVQAALCQAVSIKSNNSAHPVVQCTEKTENPWEWTISYGPP